MKLALLIFLLFSGTFGMAQKKYKTFDMKGLSYEPYEIKISEKDGKATLYISAYSVDKLSHIGIRLKERSIEHFVNALLQAKERYIDWKKTAIDNDVEEVLKPMNIKAKRFTAFFYYGSEYHFDYDNTLWFYFDVFTTKSGTTFYQLKVRSSDLQSSLNEFIKNKGWTLNFKSEEEIDGFLQSISLEEIAKYKAQPKKEDLFKD